MQIILIVPQWGGLITVSETRGKKVNAEWFAGDNELWGNCFAISVSSE